MDRNVSSRDEGLRPRGRRRCSRALGWSIRWAILLSVVVVFGCDADVRYRVLSFFFDGVPSPGGATSQSRPIIGPWGIPLDPDDPRAQEFLARAAAKQAVRGPAAEAPMFLHDPFEKRLCAQCHRPEKGYQARIEGDTCAKCHALHYRYQPNDWVHGPVALGMCSACHKSHQSQYPGLLTADVPSLCFSCHDASRVLARPHHAGVEGLRCTKCHDPHLAGNRLLLADSGSFVRRKRRLKLLPSQHSDWKKDTCTKCHQSAASKKVVDKVDEVCLSCHKKVQQPAAGRKLHEPVTKGKCISCHVAHRSPLPHLIKPEAEKNCLGCHKSKDVLTEKHPKVYRGDCLVCHTGHDSPGKHLLRPAGTTMWQVPTTQPTSRPAGEAGP